MINKVISIKNLKLALSEIAEDIPNKEIRAKKQWSILLKNKGEIRIDNAKRKIVCNKQAIAYQSLVYKHLSHYCPTMQQCYEGTVKQSQRKQVESKLQQLQTILTSAQDPSKSLELIREFINVSRRVIND